MFDESGPFGVVDIAHHHSSSSSSSSSDEIDNFESSASRASAWRFRPVFDYPQMFPYHTGFNSINGGTSTIQSPSVASSVSVDPQQKRGQERLEALGLETVLEDLHQQELSRPRPKRRIRATPRTVLSYSAKEIAEKELRKLLQGLLSRSTGAFVGNPAATPDTGELIRLHTRIARLAIQVDNSVVAKDHVTELKRLYQRQQRSSPQVWLELGHFQNDLGCYDDALESYQQAITSKGDHHAICHVSMGRTLLNKGESEKAIKALEKGHKLQHHQESHTLDQEAQVLHLLATAENQSGDPIEESLARLKLCRKIYNANKDWNNLLETYLTTGQLNASSREIEVAEQCYEHGMEAARHCITDKGRLDAYMARFYLAKGDLLQRQGIYQMQAEEMYREALSICQSPWSKEMDPETANEALVALADLHCSQGQDSQALSYLQQGKLRIMYCARCKKYNSSF